MSGGVSFVGAGPGAADLITVRGTRRIGEADVVLWAPSVADPTWIRENTRPDAELVDISRCTEEEVHAVYRRVAAARLRVVRLHAGDPATWGDLRRQVDACTRLGLEVEVVPGVSAASTVAVSLGVSLTEPEYAESVISSGADATGLPDPARIRELAQHGATMAVVLPAVRVAELVEALSDGGYDEQTPVVAAYKVSWPDELVVRTTLAELVATVKQHKLWRHTLFLVGGALRGGQAGQAEPAAASPRRRRTTEGATASARWVARARVSRRTSTPDPRSVASVRSGVATSAVKLEVPAQPDKPDEEETADVEPSAPEPVVATETEPGGAEPAPGYPGPAKASPARKTAATRAKATPKAAPKTTAKPAEAETPSDADGAEGKAEGKAEENTAPKTTAAKAGTRNTAKAAAKTTGTKGRTRAATTKTAKTGNTAKTAKTGRTTRTQRGRGTS